MSLQESSEVSKIVERLAIQATQGNRMVSVAWLAQFYDVKQATIWDWSKSGKIPKPFAIGGCTRWSLCDVLMAMATNTRPPRNVPAEMARKVEADPLDCTPSKRTARAVR